MTLTEQLQQQFDAVVPIARGPISLEDSVCRAAPLLEAAVEEPIKLLKSGLRVLSRSRCV